MWFTDLSESETVAHHPVLQNRTQSQDVLHATRCRFVGSSRQAVTHRWILNTPLQEHIFLLYSVVHHFWCIRISTLDLFCISCRKLKYQYLLRIGVCKTCYKGYSLV